MTVEESGHDVVFTRQIRRGAIGRSYGIHVAKLAGIPEEVIENARFVLASIDRKAKTVGPTSSQAAMMQVSIFDAGQQEPDSPAPLNAHNEIIRELLGRDLTQTTPLEALNFLSSLKERLES
jgi:DNA mismatch repair protein MutS